MLVENTANAALHRRPREGPELAGCAVGSVVSAETNSGVEEISPELSLTRGPTTLRKVTHRGGTCWCNTIKRLSTIPSDFYPRSIFTRTMSTVSSLPRSAGATPIFSPQVGALSQQ